jgi:ATP-dependent Lon protease
MELAGKIQAQVGSEITRAQREHFLRQQIKAIQEELGEEGSGNPELDALWKKLEDAKAPAEVLAEASRELERLAGMHPSSAEYSIVRTYLDWLAAMPWSNSSRDRLDLKRARKVLDADHYNLEKIKERILEYLAVRKLKKDMKGPILCFAGPPGTGKTSLGKSIAKALGREFVRISLGGVHDEAEIRGHRRTYVAAMPGRILQGIRKASTNNPVFMLDEVDKLGSDFRGDPSAALLEVLDPEQNTAFRDHYLDVDFDLSKVMFIATANMLETIPPPLLDRMEVLELPGYSEEEKIQIAQRHVIPKQLDAHGLTPASLSFEDGAIRRIIADYTREAGLRNLEREIATVTRKVARRHAEGKRGRLVVTSLDMPTYLGPPKYYREVADRTDTPGVSTGLAWTPSGGEILFIETTGLPGKGSLTLTGLLGESMRESAQAALTYLRTRAKPLGIEASRIAKTDVHVHVPAGAVPKDGPSAGVAIAAALISMFRNQAIHRNLAMTGEVTLTGRVLPVGGVREKVLAARRAGITTVLLPRHNEKDLIELPPEVKSDVVFHSIDTLDDVVAHLFGAQPGADRPRPSKAKARVAPPAPSLPTPDSKKPKAAPKPGRRPRTP